MKYGRQHGKNTKGFYLALGVSLLAVGAAAWVTYDSVVNFTEEPPAVSSVEPARQVEKTVSGVTESTSSAPVIVLEEPESSESPEPVSEPEPVSSGEAVSTAAEPEQEAEPANAQPEEAEQPQAEPAQADTAETPQSLAYPVGSEVSQAFSGANPVYSETMGDWRVHSGVDLPAQTGETVSAACEGVVSSVSQDALLGGCVVVTQGELELHYCGVDEICVKEGDAVAQGDPLGRLGEVPFEGADGAHLHFGVKSAGKWIDPQSLLQ